MNQESLPSVANQQQEPEPTRVEVGPIENGVEWFKIVRGGKTEDEDCQCARCGSSCAYVRCCNCSDGEVYHESWDGCGEGYYVRCDWCQGKGGSWHCISGPEWCNANPSTGREHVESSALNSEAWNDCF
jgi:hypothetical protein